MPKEFTWGPVGGKSTAQARHGMDAVVTIALVEVLPKVKLLR
jgi:hypothetical protein